MTGREEQSALRELSVCRLAPAKKFVRLLSETLGHFAIFVVTNTEPDGHGAGYGIYRHVHLIALFQLELLDDLCRQTDGPRTPHTDQFLDHVALYINSPAHRPSSAYCVVMA